MESGDKMGSAYMCQKMRNAHLALQQNSQPQAAAQQNYWVQLEIRQNS